MKTVHPGTAPGYSVAAMNTANHPSRHLAVYCGSTKGTRPEFMEEARALGAAIAAAELGMVYGGANVGLMGAVADAALDCGTEVYGVLPQVLVEREIAHPNLTHFELVDDMHQRKARMSELADGFMVLPGGFGTLDELFEAVSWSQLGIHSKPCVLINTVGYWDELLQFLDTAVSSGFLKAKNRACLSVAPDAASAVELALEFWRKKD